MERNSAVCVVAFMLFLLGSGLAMIPAVSAIDHDASGPWAENVVYNIITQDDQQVLALLDNEIDMIGAVLESQDIASESDLTNFLRDYGALSGVGIVAIIVVVMGLSKKK